MLVTDRLAWQLFAEAAREKLLFVRSSSEETPHARSGVAGQRALSLLVLFDRLVIHEFGDGIFRLPDLEKEGIVEIVPAGDVPKNVPALTTKWKKDRTGSRGRPPRVLLQSLSLVQDFRPLVINRLLMVESKFDDALAHGLGVSRREYINLLLNYAIYYIQGDEVAVRSHVFSEALPPDFLAKITEELFAFTARGDVLAPTNVTLLMATLFASEIAIIQDLARTLGLGVATEHYGEVLRPEPAIKGNQLDAVLAANRFLILRAALAQETKCMPRIEGVRHALSLRRDPYLKALREQLKLFHSGLVAGDRYAILDARKEIDKARRKLERRSKWDIALRWLAYVSVPVGIAEGLMSSPPLMGTWLCAIGAVGAAKSRKIAKHNEWVLFGT